MKTITIKDIAKKCGVGVSTVSRAINNHPDISEETRNMIMEVIKESDVLKEHWKNYQSKFSYAEDIGYEDTMEALEKIKNLFHIY